MECFRQLFDHLAWIEHQFLSGIRDSRKAESLWGMMRGVRGVSKSWLAKGLGLGLLCWGFKGVQQEIPSEEASTLQIGSVAFPPGQCHQSTTPSMSLAIWARWASRQFLSLPIVQTLPPVTFGYSLSSEAIVMRQLRRWKSLWRKSLTCSHKRTSMGRSRSCWNGTTSALQLEEITSKGTRVSCCMLSIKVPIRNSLETYRMHLVYHFQMSQCFQIIWVSGGRVLSNVITKRMQFIFNFGFSFRVSFLGVEMAFVVFSVNVCGWDIPVLINIVYHIVFLIRCRL